MLRGILAILIGIGLIAWHVKAGLMDQHYERRSHRPYRQRELHGQAAVDRAWLGIASGVFSIGAGIFLAIKGAKDSRF